MKLLQTLSILLAVLVIQACGSSVIRVENDITGVEIQDVRWGDYYLAGSLLPGQTSGDIEILHSEAELPLNQQVTFVMRANNRVIFLETVGSYSLDKDDDVTIVLGDDTEVRNP